jgi:Transposase DDE domain
MASIRFIADQIKKDPADVLRYLPIREVCGQLGVVFRDRLLDPATTIGLFIRQIVNGNSSCARVRQLGTRNFTAQAYCSARMRLPLAVLLTLSRRLCDAVRVMRESKEKTKASDLFLTHRVFVVDGSTFSMPDTPELQKEFGQPGAQKKGCGFPAAHLLALFDVNTGMLIDAIPSPMRTHDLAKVAQMHPHLKEGDLLIGDTAFGSYTHFTLLLQGKMHGMMPAHQNRIIDFTPHRPFVMPGKVDDESKGQPRSRWIKSLGEQDQLVEWFKPPNRPTYMTREQYEALPASIVVRELRRRIFRPELNRWLELTIVTTLLNEKTYPAEKLVELRLRRWQIEVNLRHLKTTMGLEVLKCKTVDGVRKELAVFALVYNLVRLVMLEAAVRQNTKPDRISFADVLGWIKAARPGQIMPRFIVNPNRPNRIEPRVKKRRPKPYDLMNRPRQELRNRLKTKAKTA